MITSTSNPRIRRVMQLQKQAKARREAGVFVVEGRKMWEEAPKARVEEVYFSESYVAEQGMPATAGAAAEVVSDSVFRSMSDTMSPQGILAVVKQAGRSLEEILSAKQAPAHLIILENLQDPGNLGTILRTAEGAGVTGVLLSAECVDVYNPKVIRSTMGSLYRVPFLTGISVKEVIPRLQDAGIRCLAAALEQSQDYAEADYTGPVAFLIGNEGNGLKPETVKAADGAVRIPMEGQVESLNAAMAAGLLMYEALRQRRKQ